MSTEIRVEILERVQTKREGWMALLVSELQRALPDRVCESISQHPTSELCSLLNALHTFNETKEHNRHAIVVVGDPVGEDEIGQRTDAIKRLVQESRTLDKARLHIVGVGTLYEAVALSQAGATDIATVESLPRVVRERVQRILADRLIALE